MQRVPALTEADRVSYPALLPAEIAVWRVWLRLHQAEYDRFDYNMRIGPGADPGPSYPQDVRDMAIHNTQKRIDAVAWRGAQPLVIEVKDRATLASVGQLMGYIVYWKGANPNGPLPQALLVANRLAPGLADVLAAHNLPYELVGQ